MSGATQAVLEPTWGSGESSGLAHASQELAPSLERLPLDYKKLLNLSLLRLLAQGCPGDQELPLGLS